ncbi:replication-relaxation family protein [Ammoniphilus resinae]|uniref:Replication-relaxation n=1 Tax=Ammoniphilus resinae TaxID=861532 RepID=A0ABS4GX73_9BACL|nr:replication-relaxation family protein [Ammoniphilus resinae]MBP1934875.1 hypothetical protein [Ammoniphilus resinae]
MERLLKSRKLSRYERKEEDIKPREALQKATLTQRDREVLLSLYYHRCLTTEQIAEMHFRFNDHGKENSQALVIARRRLRKLFDLKLIDRFFINVGENNGSSQAHMILDQLGARIVAGILNTTVQDLGWKYEMNAVRLPYLDHMLEVNDFYLCLLRAARSKGHEIGEFKTENLTRYEFKHGSRIIFNPDAYGTYFAGETGFHFFHERDRGTMTLDTFQKKHRRYAAFYQSEEYLNYFDSFPLVLTVAPTWERALALRECIYAIDNTDIQWLFTSDDLAKTNVLGPIWIGKENHPVSLIPLS